jgi:hypothetical protein
MSGQPQKPSDTEVDAYVFIREQLAATGWVVKNPSRYPDGQVWTQNQCLADPFIKQCLGAKRPENIVRLSGNRLWVLEAKRDRAELRRALREAEVDYATPLRASGAYSVPIITGVAGNDHTGYEIRTRLWANGEYQTVTINGRDATGLLDPKTVELLLATGNPNIADLIINEGVFLRAAEYINRTLHLGGINKNDRARVMAALLLALLEEPGPNVTADLPVLIDDINARTRSILRKHYKPEFYPFVAIQPPTNTENHIKFKMALTRTIQELNNLSIKSAMNSGTDVLGKFYEVFLKYGNGAKEIGIVLTPRHLTRFAVDTVGVSPYDVVLDPACGTGGFLVAALDYVRQNSSAEQLDRFKQCGLFGIEQESAVAALAIVNMIFRGDGKNNMTEANAFTQFLKRATINDHPSAKFSRTPPSRGEEAVTRIFMNPPFALKQSDERESRFIEAALRVMVDGGILFAIVPMSVMTEAGREGLWRRDVLLSHNRLLSVISLPEELFYPIANQTVAVILKKGVPHAAADRVLWGRVENDGFYKSKGRRLPTPPNARNDLADMEPILRSFLANPKARVQARAEWLKVAVVDYSDPIMELVPEAYLDSNVPGPAGLASRLDRQVRENVAALVDVDLRFGQGGPSIIDSARASEVRKRRFPIKLPDFQEVGIEELFELRAGEYHSLGDLDPGATPVVACGDMGNGIVGAYTVPNGAVYSHAMTVAFNGRPLTTKMHPYRFSAKDDVAVAVPRQTLSPEVLVFIQAALNSERWRFSYYRKCFRAKLERLKIMLPIDGKGKLALSFMEAAVQAQPYWWFLAPRLQGWKTETPG